MVRTGIATPDTIKEVLENAGTPLSYGATAESWREALTSISGEDETITPRETEETTGWSSTNETILTTFNREETTENKYTVDIIFLANGNPVEVEAVKLGDIEGVKEEEHYEFANIDSELDNVELTFTYEGNSYTVTKSYSSFVDDIVVIDSLVTSESNGDEDPDNGND